MSMHAIIYLVQFLVLVFEYISVEQPQNRAQNLKTFSYLPLLTNFFSKWFGVTLLNRLLRSSVSGGDVITLFCGLGWGCCRSSGGVTGLSVVSSSGLWSRGNRGGRREYVFCAMELDFIEFGCWKKDCGSDRSLIGNGSTIFLEKRLPSIAINNSHCLSQFNGSI